jgi:pantoate--beta-alanine ligase
MRTLRTIAELRAALAHPRREGSRIGLVPTMGAFHEGHLSLMRRARADCDVVLVSLFVNPTQFNEDGDLAAYPRDERRDALMASEAGVDYLFAPALDEVYPPGFAATVQLGSITEVLEGAQRGRAHFEGVATVVTKLFNMVAPDVAYFGQKDAQQTRVIGQLVRDLNMQVQIEICPIIREADGLALSSRNVRLSGAEREQAAALSRGLRVAAELAGAGESDANAVCAAARAELDAAGLSTEYFQIVDGKTFVPITTIDGPALAVVAAWVGNTRLIDNHPLSTRSASGPYATVATAGSDQGENHVVSPV